jgi:hypothetical protein
MHSAWGEILPASLKAHACHRTDRRQSVEKLKDGMLAIARSMGQTSKRTLTAFLDFMAKSTVTCLRSPSSALRDVRIFCFGV